jgi:hypothetical protein
MIRKKINLIIFQSYFSDKWNYCIPEFSKDIKEYLGNLDEALEQLELVVRELLNKNYPTMDYEIKISFAFEYSTIDKNSQSLRIQREDLKKELSSFAEENWTDFLSTLDCEDNEND